MFKQKLGAVAFAAALFAIQFSSLSAVAKPVQIAQNQNQWKWIKVPGYQLAIPSHFQPVKHSGDGPGVWRFSVKTMQVKITAWQQEGWSAADIVSHTYQELGAMSNKQVRMDKDITELTQAKSKSYSHYIDGTGVFQNRVWGFAMIGFNNPNTQHNISIRADWHYQNSEAENQMYHQVVDQMIYSVTAIR